MKKRAFTASEIILAMTIIGIITVIATTAIFKDGSIDKKKIRILTKDFYSEVSRVFATIVLKDTKGKGIKTIDSEAFMKAYVKYAGDVEAGLDNRGGSCKDFATASSVEGAFITDKVKCTSLPKKILAGFMIDPNCATKVRVAEYYGDEVEQRDIEGLCGYIIYEFENQSAGTLGEDLFIIPLGNRSVK